MEKKAIILMYIVSIILLTNIRPTVSTACSCGNPGACEISYGRPLCDGYCSRCSNTACSCGNPGACELSYGRPLCAGYCRGCSNTICSCGNPGACELSYGRPLCGGYCAGCRLEADVAGKNTDEVNKKEKKILDSKNQEV